MQGSRRVNRPLTEISVRYDNDEYIARQVAPDVMVKKESDVYFVYTNDHLRLEETARANGAPSNQATFGVSTTAYSLSEHALHDVITDRDRENIDAPLQLDKDTTEYLTSQILLRQEVRTQNLVFTTTSWANNAALNTATSWRENTTTSAPVQNILSATAVINNGGGGKANMLVINLGTLFDLKENTQLHERVKYVQQSTFTPELLSSLFDLQKVLVGSAVRDTAKEGETQSLTAIWGANALIANIEASPRLKTRTAVATLRMRRFGSPFLTKKWRDEDRSGDKVEVSSLYAPKLIATSSAFLFTSVTST